jgi:hypothetical protein
MHVQREGYRFLTVMICTLKGKIISTAKLCFSNFCPVEEHVNQKYEME